MESAITKQDEGLTLTLTLTLTLIGWNQLLPSKTKVHTWMRSPSSLSHLGGREWLGRDTEVHVGGLGDVDVEH